MQGLAAIIPYQQEIKSMNKLQHEIKHQLNCKTYKNEILNFFKEYCESDFYLNFLPSKENDFTKKLQIPTRKEAKCAHCRILPYIKKSDSFTEYQNSFNVYITFNDFSKNLKEATISLREDLLKYWIENGCSNIYVLCVSKKTKRLYLCKAENLVDDYIKRKTGDKKGFVNANGYVCVIFEVSYETVLFESKMNNEDTTDWYLSDYYRPETIGKCRYSVSIKSVPLKICLFDKKTGKKKSNEMTYISKGQLFNSLQEHNIIDEKVIKRTFNRWLAAAEVDGSFYVDLSPSTRMYFTFDLEKDLTNCVEQDAVYQTVVTDNPFYNPSIPEDSENPKQLINKFFVKFKEKDLISVDKYKDLYFEKAEEKEVDEDFDANVVDMIENIEEHIDNKQQIENTRIIVQDLIKDYYIAETEEEEIIAEKRIEKLEWEQFVHSKEAWNKLGRKPKLTDYMMYKKGELDI